jgi:DNA invertase Pin-like site-specific DNA recombinase
MARRTTISDLSADELVRLYQFGETIAMIAAMIDSNRESVRRRLKGAGIRLRPRGARHGRPRLDLPVTEIVERYLEGESIATIGRSLEVSHHVIRMRLIEAGVERRRPWSHRWGVRVGREEG